MYRQFLLSMVLNLYRGHPSTSIPFKFTYPCRLLVTHRTSMFHVTVHHYGYHFIICNGYSSQLISDLQRSSTYCYKYTAILFLEVFYYLGCSVCMLQLSGPTVTQTTGKARDTRRIKNFRQGVKTRAKMAIFCKKKKWSMKIEDISYSVMDIKKGLRMIRLCNLQHSKHEFCCIQVHSLYENPMEIQQGMLCKKALSPM